jgi:hypothetical protein
MTELLEPEVVPAPTNAALRQTLLEAFTKGNGGAAGLSSLLRHANLSAEQQAVVDVLFTMHGEEEQPAREEPTIERRRVAGISPLQQELEDLREVNDTVAAALGACRFCWGGNRQCEECGGRGRAGSRVPDPDLFNEVVAPAVRRVCQERESRPTRAGRGLQRGIQASRTQYRPTAEVRK